MGAVLEALAEPAVAVTLAVAAQAAVGDAKCQKPDRKAGLLVSNASQMFEDDRTRVALPYGRASDTLCENGAEFEL